MSRICPGRHAVDVVDKERSALGVSYLFPPLWKRGLPLVLFLLLMHSLG
jgi:hypothetical protein